METAASEQDEIDVYYATVGSRLVAGGISLNTKAENLGQLNVSLRNRSDESVEEAVVGRLRERFAVIPDLDAKFGRPSYFSLKTPVELILYGDNLEELRDYSLDLAQQMGTLPGLVDVRSSLEAGNPELQIIFDRDRLAAMGLDMGVLSETLRSRVQGVVPTRFKEADRRSTSASATARSDRQPRCRTWKAWWCPARTERPIRLLTVADVSCRPRSGGDPPGAAAARGRRQCQPRAGAAWARWSATWRTCWRRTRRPRGSPPSWAGRTRRCRCRLPASASRMILAIFLVYLVMAATFESLHPSLRRSLHHSAGPGGRGGGTARHRHHHQRDRAHRHDHAGGHRGEQRHRAHRQAINQLRRLGLDKEERRWCAPGTSGFVPS